MWTFFFYLRCVTFTLGRPDGNAVVPLSSPLRLPPALHLPLFLELFIFRPLPTAVVSYRRGNHLTLTLSGDHIDFLAGVIAIKTRT